VKCCCEDAGTVRSGIKGILVGPPSDMGRSQIIEKCDACERFDSDEAAAVYYATSKGGAARYSKSGNRLKVLWSPR
jgi:hypothetical protein